MRHTIELSEGKIIYQLPAKKLNYTSWKVAIEDIALIAKVNAMDGDSDSDILVIIDWQKRKYFLNLTDGSAFFIRMDYLQ